MRGEISSLTTFGYSNFIIIIKPGSYMNNIKRVSLLLGLSIICLAFTYKPTQDHPIWGFSKDHISSEYLLEHRFDSYLNRKDMMKWLQFMASQPNGDGSPHDSINAAYVAQKMNKWGWDAKIVKYYVLFPTPREQELELVAPTHYKAKLREPSFKQVPVTYHRNHELPPYNAFSADGDVTGKLVYVNQGIPGDYDYLDKLGISVKGKIVIVRYGGSFRGVKAKLAYEHGAIGCIIYSDPKDDGYARGDVYPDGPWRPKYGVQRGSLLDITKYAGDPLTPGYAATKNAKRIPIKDAPTIMKIPVQPISYADALPLLKALGGPVAPASWRGALPITYHIGPGAAKVHLKLTFNWKLVTDFDTIAMIKGSEYPDQWVIRGNHRDGWVFGAEDPLSSLMAELGEAKAMGQLLKTGWRPKRTIIYCSWDGEEPGLFGSTEWVEQHAEELQKKGVVYINTDDSGRGFLSMGGSPVIQKMLNEVASDIKDPETNVSILRRDRLRMMVSGNSHAQNATELPVHPLGSGSDFTPFLQHIGISSMDLGFYGENYGGYYHSLYDTYDHYMRFGDPGFHYGVTLAESVGHSILRFADADIIPFGFRDFSNDLGKYVDQLKKQNDVMRKDIKNHNKLVSLHAYKTIANPSRPFVSPQKEDIIPKLFFSPLYEAVKNVKHYSALYDSLLANKLNNGTLSTKKAADINKQLIETDRALTYSKGLPGTPWFKHEIYATGPTTGYSVKTLPAIHIAMDAKKWTVAQQQIPVVAGVLNHFADELQNAVNELK